MAVPYECARKHCFGGTQTWHLDTKAKSLTDAHESPPELHGVLECPSLWDPLHKHQ